MKILMYRWKAYNQFDIIACLEKRGHIVDEVHGEMCNFEDDPGFANKFCQVLDSDSYDMVFTVNYFPLISDACQTRNIPYVSWTCDSPLGTMYNQSVYNSVNTIFTFDKLNQLDFQGMGARVCYLPLCTDCERVDKLLEAASGEELESYSGDVAFVGSMYNKNSYDEVYEHLPEYLKGYFDAALKLQMNVYGDYLLDDILDAHTVYELNRNFVLAKSGRSFSDLGLIFSTTVLGFKIAQMERKTLITQLSRQFDVNVYTDDNQFDFVKAVNRGTVDYWSQAPKAFHQSKINLNLTLRNIRSGLPLRIWDIMGAGGFCMTNFQPELPMYFENGRDIVYFEDRYDLAKKTEYYLNHEDERMEIARNGYEKVKKYHQYNNRIDEMAKYIPGL